MKYRILLHKFGFIFLLALVSFSPFAINRTFERPSVSQRAFIIFAIMSVIWLLLPILILSGVTRLKRGKPVYFVLLYILSIVISSIFSGNPSFSFYEMIYLLPAVIYYLTLVSLKIKTRDIHKILFFLSLTTIPVIIFAVLQNYGIDVFGYEKTGMIEKKKIASFFGNPNYLASYLSPVLFLTLGACIISRKKTFRTICGFISISIIFCLFLAGTRAAWLGVATGFGISLILFLKYGSVKKKYIHWGILIAASLLIMVLLFFLLPGEHLPFEIRERIFSMNEVYGRLFLWQIGKNMFMDHPLTGVGFHRYHVEVNHYAYDFFQTNPHARAYESYVGTGRIQRYLHNEYYEILVESGLLGLFFFIGIIVSTFTERLKGLKESFISNRFVLFRIFMLGSLSAMLMDAFWGFPFQLPCSGILFWLILALNHKLEEPLIHES